MNTCKQRLPAILNSSLLSNDVHKLLVDLYKVRVSSTTLECSIIFPSSNVTFLLLDINNVFGNDVNSDGTKLKKIVFHRLDKLLKLHKNCYVLFRTTSHGDANAYELFVAMQNRYLFTRLKLVPVADARQAVQCMQDVANISSKPMSNALFAGLDRVIDSQTSYERCGQLSLQSIGLSDHECLVLMDGRGSLADIASATEDSLLDCSLSTSSAAVVLSFLHTPVRPPADQLY